MGILVISKIPDEAEAPASSGTASASSGTDPAATTTNSGEGDNSEADSDIESDPTTLMDTAAANGDQLVTIPANLALNLTLNPNKPVSTEIIRQMLTMIGLTWFKNSRRAPNGINSWVFSIFFIVLYSKNL